MFARWLWGNVANAGHKFRGGGDFIKKGAFFRVGKEGLPRHGTHLKITRRRLHQTGLQLQDFLLRFTRKTWRGGGGRFGIVQRHFWETSSSFSSCLLSSSSSPSSSLSSFFFFLCRAVVVIFASERNPALRF